MNQITLRRTGRLLFLLTAAMTLTSINAFAGGAGTLPWDTGLAVLIASITGPVAYAISLGGVAVGFGTLLFGGQLNDFARYGLLSTGAIGGLLLTAQLLSGLYGVAGAIV